LKNIKRDWINTTRSWDNITKYFPNITRRSVNTTRSWDNTTLIRAMNDDTLVDAVAEFNLKLVNSLANRNKIKKTVIDFYAGLQENK
jgi:hypothetical protein